MVEVTKTRDAYGIEFTAICECGLALETYCAKDSGYSGVAWGDLDCDVCGRTYNCSGQRIAFKYGDGSDD